MGQFSNTRPDSLLEFGLVEFDIFLPVRCPNNVQKRTTLPNSIRETEAGHSALIFSQIKARKIPSPVEHKITYKTLKKSWAPAHRPVLTTHFTGKMVLIEKRGHSREFFLTCTILLSHNKKVSYVRFIAQ